MYLSLASSKLEKATSAPTALTKVSRRGWVFYVIGAVNLVYWAAHVGTQWNGDLALNSVVGLVRTNSLPFVNAR